MRSFTLRLRSRNFVPTSPAILVIFCPRHFGVSGKTVRSCSFRPGKLQKPKGLARYFCAGK
jgi:hypothetical protein